MIISRDVYIDEDLKLILSSLEESVRRTWNTKLLRSYSEGKTSVMNDLYQELIKLEIFPYINSTSLFNSAIINEVIGSYLLPGIIASTIIAVKSIQDKQLLEDIFRGRVKVAFSDVDLVPAADQADVIIVGNNMVWKEEASITPYSSLDNSMKICRVSFNKSQHIEFNPSNAMVNISAQIVGAAEAVVNMSVEYAKNRIAFGKPIGSYQAIKHKLVDDAITVEL
ncbi:MAG: acyl-CoA dehydrogenase family protein, partial [Sulfolobales archaeon]